MKVGGRKSAISPGLWPGVVLSNQSGIYPGPRPGLIVFLRRTSGSFFPELAVRLNISGRGAAAAGLRQFVFLLAGRWDPLRGAVRHRAALPPRIGQRIRLALLRAFTIQLILIGFEEILIFLIGDFGLLQHFLGDLLAI